MMPEPTAQDVIDALRIVLPAQRDPQEITNLTRLLVGLAPPPDGDRGTKLLLELLAEGSLTVQLA